MPRGSAKRRQRRSAVNLGRLWESTADLRRLTKLGSTPMPRMIIEPVPIYAERAPQDSAAQPASHRFGYQPRRGLSIPAVTVLDAAGRVIESEQRGVFRYLAQQGQGADILFGAGTTGEWNRIANSERQRLIWIETDEAARIN